MRKREWIVVPFVTLVMLISLTACSDTASEFIIFGNHENMSDASRDYLFNCLDDRGLEVKIDGQKNILIQERETKIAIASCS